MASSALLSSVRNSIKKTHLPFKFHLFAIRPSSSLFSTLCKNQHSFTLPQLAPPVPKKVPFTVSAHGRTWQDPYHWMSNTNDPDFINYLNQENSYADAFMKDTVELQRTLYSEMVNRLPSKISTPPERWGPWLYYQYIPEGQEYPVLCRKLANGGEGWMKKVVNYIGKGLGKEEILLDWNEIAELYGYVHVGTCRISPDNNFLAYTLDVNGNEQFVLQIKDLQRKSLISNHRVEGVVNLAWARDSCSLFYTLCDQNQRPYRVQCVKLGSDSMDNVPLFVESDSRFCVDITSTKDGQFITVNSNSRASSEVYVMDAVNPQSGLQRFCKRVSGVKYFLEHHEGFFYVLTNAPLSKDESSCENYYLGRCRAEDLQSTNLQTIILPNEDMCLLDMDIFNEHIVLFLNQEGSSSICSIDMRNLSKCKTQVKIDDLNPWFFPLPSNMCTVTPGVNHDFMSPVYRVMLSSSVMPDVIVDYDMSTKTYLVVQQEEVPNIGQSRTEIQNIQSEKRKNAQENEAWGIKNFSDLYCCEKIEVISHDGIRVPLTVLCSKEEHRNGQSPGLLHGYGAYGEVLDKSWCADQLSLLDRGWLIAFADVRGGAGADPSWHGSGSGLHKLNSIHDFVSCANYLVNEGYVHKQRLSAVAHSAGCFLVGAAINMHPHLFRAAILKVPFLDICSTLLDTNLPLTLLDYEEFGNPQIESHFYNILKCSPYDNIPEGICSPAMLVTSSFNDSRVGVWEAAKWVARVRDVACPSCSSSVILRSNMLGGHFGEGGRFGHCEEMAQEYAFLLKILGTFEQ